jgi:hypothetical protein
LCLVAHIEDDEMGTAAAVLEQYVQQTLLPQGLPIHIDFQVLLATTWLAAVFRIRIRIHVFFGLPDPDPLVRGMDPDPALDPDPSIIMQK